MTPDPLKPKPETLGFEREAEHLIRLIERSTGVELKELSKKVALALEAAFSKGWQKASDQSYWEDRVKEAHAESRYGALEQAAKVAENYTSPSKDVCGQADHDIRWCSDCDRMTAIAEVIEQEIRALKPAKGESKRDLKDLTPLDKIQGIWKDKLAGEK